MPGNYTKLCLECGKLSRLPGWYGEKPPPPYGYCCDREMRGLSHVQAVAASKLSPAERIAWSLAGGRLEKRPGRRQWRAVW